MTKRITKTVAELESNIDLVFVSDSQDVKPLREYFGKRRTKDFDSFFVKVDSGNYSEVWGIVGIIPQLNKLATKLL